MAEGGAAPAARRIEALDFVRGAALLGILLMNITGFGLAQSYANPTNSGGATGADLWAWMITQIGFEGTQRALFSILFGASAILLTQRLEAAGRADAADIYFRRNLWLIGFGMVNAYLLLWWGDILYAYGITALFIYVFRKLPPMRLLLIGLAALIGSMAWNASDTIKLLDAHSARAEAVSAQDRGEELSEAQTQAIAAWDEARLEFKAAPAAIAEENAARSSGYASAFAYVSAYNVYWQTWGLYRYFFDLFGMMLIGMALFRWGVLTLERPTWLYVAMVLGGYGIGLPVNYAETRWILDHQFSALAFSQANISYDVGRLAMTIGHLGVLLLFVRSGVLGWLRRAVAAVGQMAVTNYLAQSAICAAIFTGLGWFGQLERHQLYYVVAGIWAAQLLWSRLWLSYFRFGPVEWLWRWLTYGSRPPMRRVAAA